MPSDAPPKGESDLSFDRAEYAAPPPSFTCAGCKRELDDEYFQIGNASVCDSCRARFVAAQEDADSAGVFARAAGYGLGAALVGALLWWAVEVVTKMHIGLVAIVVGYLVGTAVRRGSRGRGGARYQALAMSLAYAGITMANVPAVLGAAKAAGIDDPSLPGVIAISLAEPFLGGFENVIGLLIIGFALYEAWKLNRGGQLTVAGPFRRGDAPAASG